MCVREWRRARQRFGTARGLVAKLLRGSLQWPSSLRCFTHHLFCRALAAAVHRHRLVATVSDFLYRLTEPALRPIRNLMPNFGNIDLSPIVLILLLQAARMILDSVYRSLILGSLLPLL